MLVFERTYPKVQFPHFLALVLKYQKIEKHRYRNVHPFFLFAIHIDNSGGLGTSARTSKKGHMGGVPLYESHVGHGFVTPPYGNHDYNAILTAPIN